LNSIRPLPGSGKADRKALRLGDTPACVFPIRAVGPRFYSRPPPERLGLNRRRQVCNQQEMQMVNDQATLDALLQRIVGEIGATASAPLVILGDRLGLYKALAGAGPLTAEQLADRTGVRLRYTQEWLNAQAASGFIDYDPAGETFTLSPEAAMAL